MDESRLSKRDVVGKIGNPFLANDGLAVHTACVNTKYTPQTDRTR
jgi:hypothetical protein